jgi:hypothetical protein
MVNGGEAAPGQVTESGRLFCSLPEMAEKVQRQRSILAIDEHAEGQGRQFRKKLFTKIGGAIDIVNYLR